MKDKSFANYWNVLEILNDLEDEIWSGHGLLGRFRSDVLQNHDPIRRASDNIKTLLFVELDSQNS
jgi:hypothetical protein